jgi:hypothetical protein
MGDERKELGTWSKPGGKRRTVGTSVAKHFNRLHSGCATFISPKQAPTQRWKFLT